MPLLNSSAVLGLIKTYRVVWIGGRYGGGKTALAYRLAHDLLEQGFVTHLAANCRNVWGDELDDIKPEVSELGSYLNTCVLLDEGGLFLRTGKDSEDYMAFMRKFNVVLLIPSVQPPTSRVRFLSIQRMYNLKALGIPLWLYKCTLRYENIKESYWFGWWRPEEIYGVYDTLDVPVDDAGISDWLIEFKEQQVEAAGHGKHRKYGVARDYGPGVQVSGLEEFAGISDTFAEVAEQISGLVPVLESSAREKKRRRR